MKQRMTSQQPPFDTRGNETLLYKKNRIGLFCSNKCPGDIILRCQDWANNLRKAETVIVSGFHTPVERDVLRILLRGGQPVIICPPRSLAKMRLPVTWKKAIEAETLCLAAQFSPSVRRASTQTAQQRNQFVAGLSEAIMIPYAAPGSRTEAMAKSLLAAEDFLAERRIVYTFSSPYTENLQALGCAVIQ